MKKHEVDFSAEAVRDSIIKDKEKLIKLWGIEVYEQRLSKLLVYIADKPSVQNEQIKLESEDET